MRVPVIGVTGPIASGKTTVARFIAGDRGALVDCDKLGARALASAGVRRDLVAAFGALILNRDGAVNRSKLARVVFASDRALDRLNRIVRPSLKRIITEEVLKRRAGAEYIVLDAVLLFQYKFRFKVDYVVVTRASLAARVRRIMERDRISRAAALARIERQRDLEEGWRRADAVLATDGSIARLKSEAVGIRDRFLARAGEGRRDRRCRRG